MVVVVVVVLAHLSHPIIVRSTSLIHEHTIGGGDRLELESATRRLLLRSVVVVVVSTLANEETVGVGPQCGGAVRAPELCGG